MRARSDLTRRAFLTGCAGALTAGVRGAAQGRHGRGSRFPDPLRERRGVSGASYGMRALPARTALEPPPDIDWDAAREILHGRYPDLRRHFVFEYYPWYGSDPFRHWDEAGRVPPLDLASNSMPFLGPYDSRSTAVLEQHARWIAEAGVGAINVSWWGPGSFCDRAVPLMMDVMAAHDIRVTFHLEPYRDDRAWVFADDIMYLIRKYGDDRGWDAFLLLPSGGGAVGPVFKSFRTILPSVAVDCFGAIEDLPDYSADFVWRAQTDRLRQELSHDFRQVVLLADSLDVSRTAASGFDGIAIYDNYFAPENWPTVATWCEPDNLLFSFNVNPGADPILPRDMDSDPCVVTPRFEPDIGDIVWSDDVERERAGRVSEDRIADTFTRTVQLQLDPAGTNFIREFFLVYVNSFNEWHEGHQFEPMRSRQDLTPDELTLPYHNADDGSYRLRCLRALLDRIL